MITTITSTLTDSDIKVLSIIVTILLGLIGYLYKYFDDRTVRIRASKLALVNKRLEDFYGPLYFRSISGAEAFQALLKKLKKRRMSENPTETELVEWRIWYKEIFHPYNLEVENVIINHSYLMLEKSIPKPLVDFVAHISEYKAIVAKWEKDNFTDHFATIQFPKDLKEYVHNSYKKLKDEQMKLLNIED